jgi:hypothetical protein
MNSLPFISHHLFVAAVKQDGLARRRPSREAMPTRERQTQTTEAQLEFVTGAEETPAHAVRRLAVSPLLRGA